ncbi:hypothetical protein [Chryseobacterium sp. Leaf405]|uniref:hypothetical protein n=1 Tax=Chryseobacterium sp. Leaf405 TaxID=1736367 RepID=UPI00396489AA
MHISGHEIIPPIYDYISPLIADEFYKIFMGDYSWEYHDHSSDYFFRTYRYSFLEKRLFYGQIINRTMGSGCDSWFKLYCFDCSGI